MDTEKTFLKCGELEIGMDLRDWFAGQAISVMFAVNRDYLAKVSKDPRYPINAATARDAYALADAMMEARK